MDFLILVVEGDFAIGFGPKGNFCDRVEQAAVEVAEFLAVAYDQVAVLSVNKVVVA